MSKAPQDIIIKPVITEKSSYDAALGKYTFQVGPQVISYKMTPML